MSQKKLKVGVLGATGNGRSALPHVAREHPWYDVTLLAASAKLRRAEVRGRDEGALGAQVRHPGGRRRPHRPERLDVKAIAAAVELRLLRGRHDEGGTAKLEED